MKTIYTAYVKTLENINFYFVKRFTAFPELQGVPDFLEGFGMHKDFDEACRIAGVTEQNVKKFLLSEIDSTLNETKVIQMNPSAQIISKSGS